MKNGKKKYGIPMSSIGGGSLLSGIAQWSSKVACIRKIVYNHDNDILSEVVCTFMYKEFTNNSLIYFSSFSTSKKACTGTKHVML